MTRNTIRSLQSALAALASAEPGAEKINIIVAIDGPRSNQDDQRAVAEVAQIAVSGLPDAEIHKGRVNRGLPAHLVETLDSVLGNEARRRVICIEDDVELSPSALLALLTASQVMQGEGYVIGAAPLHRDDSVEHQALLLDRRAHAVASDFLRTYIRTFSLDGAEREGAYGGRDHEGIFRWSTAVATKAGVAKPTGTSQDRMRELAWRIGQVQLVGLPTRMVRHRGYWGQHNTPWYALRTGQLWQRLDQRPWEGIKEEVVRALTERGPITPR